MRIGARGAALASERHAHKKRAERVCGSPDALWGRIQSDMQPKNLDRNRSTDRSTRFRAKEQFNSQILKEGNEPGAVTITGPDAEDIHVAGGEE